jgi:glycosyltransferase involved in cell wall biosynthesis
MTDVPVERTVVVHHGVDLPDPAGIPEDRDSSPARPFLLYVGLRGGYKNFDGLLRGVGTSSRLSSDCDVVVFGGPPLSGKEYEAAAAAGIAGNRLRHAGRDEKTLQRLYQRAAAFVYPSLYEGFGMPPLEAMAHGCPVVCSHHASLPEVVGDAAETFDGKSPEDIGMAIERVVYSAPRREELIAAGHRRAAIFTWQRCAEQTRAVYRTVTASR